MNWSCHMRARANLTIELDTPVIDKQAPRANAVVPLFSGKLVYAPFLHDTGVWERVWSRDAVISNVEKFPMGRHDDIVDTVSGALGITCDATTSSSSTRSTRRKRTKNAIAFKGNRETVAECSGVG